MSFLVSKDGTQDSAKPYSSLGGIPYMYGSGDHTTTISNSQSITGSDIVSGDSFGATNVGTPVAVGSGRIVVGAPDNDDAGTSSGSAYIFDYDGNQIAKIVAFDAVAGDDFGNAVAVGGGRIVVGAQYSLSFSGSAYIFDLNGTLVSKVAKGAGERMGSSVAVGNGRVVVGLPFDDGAGTSSGSAWIFDLNGNDIAQITAPDASEAAYFGWSAAVGCDRIVVGAHNDNGEVADGGAVYIFDLDGNFIKRIEPTGLIAAHNFGASVAIGCGRIAVGGDGNTSSQGWIFDLDGNEISTVTNPGNIFNNFGGYCSIGSGRIVIGGSSTGAILDLDGNQIATFSGSACSIGLGKFAVTSSTNTVTLYDTPSVVTPYDLIDWERGY